MGSSLSKRLDSEEVHKIQTNTVFTRDEILEMYSQFKFLTGGEKKITRAQLLQAMRSTGLYSTTGGSGDDPKFLQVKTAESLVLRLFDAFAAKANVGDEGIDFEELCAALSAFASPNVDDMLATVFKVFNEDGTDYITEAELVRAFTSLSLALELPQFSSDVTDDPAAVEERIRAWAHTVIEEHDRAKDGRLDFVEFCSAMRAHPIFLEVTQKLVTEVCADVFQGSANNGLASSVNAPKSPTASGIRARKVANYPARWVYHAEAHVALGQCFTHVVAFSGKETPEEVRMQSSLYHDGMFFFRREDPRAPKSPGSAALAAPAAFQLDAGGATSAAATASSMNVEDVMAGSGMDFWAAESHRSPALPCASAAGHLTVGQQQPRRLSTGSQGGAGGRSPGRSPARSPLNPSISPFPGEAPEQLYLLDKFIYYFSGHCHQGNTSNARPVVQDALPPPALNIHIDDAQSIIDEKISQKALGYAEAKGAAFLRMPLGLSHGTYEDAIKNYEGMALLIGPCGKPLTTETTARRPPFMFLFCAEESQASMRASKILASMFDIACHDMCIVQTLWTVAARDIGHVMNDTEDKWRRHMAHIKAASQKLANQFRERIAVVAAAQSLALAKKSTSEKYLNPVKEKFVSRIGVSTMESQDWGEDLLKASFGNASTPGHSAAEKIARSPAHVVIVMGIQSRSMQKKAYSELAGKFGADVQVTYMFVN